MFIAPCDGGTGVLVSQVQDGKQVLVTTLEHFKQYGQGSSPLVIFTLYDDLKYSKDIVLVRGDILTTEDKRQRRRTTTSSTTNLEDPPTEEQDDDSIFGKEKAQGVLEYLVDCYTDRKVFSEFVEPFNLKPREFEWEHLKKEVWKNPKYDYPNKQRGRNSTTTTTHQPPTNSTIVF